MQATVETISTLERRLTVAMPLKPIEDEIGKRLNALSRTAKLPGFRPGKVPHKMVMQQYGAGVRQEVISSNVEKTFDEAVTQHKLRVAGYPSIAPKPLAEGADNYEYTATFEVFPEVVVGDLSKLKIEKPTVALTDADLNKTIDVMRKQRAVFEPVKRAAKLQDRISIAFTSTIAGKQVEDTQGQAIELTLGEDGRLADFDNNLVGLKAGQSKQFDLAFPADYQSADLAGKTATYDINLVAVTTAKLPEVNADFARELGVADGDVEKMRAEIKLSLEQEVENRVKALVKQQVMEGLADAVTLDLPRALVVAESNQQMQMTIQNLKQRGMDESQININPAMFEEQAKKSVKLRMILVEIIRTNNLQATPEQIRAQIDIFAQSFEDAGEVVAWYYADPQRLDEPAAVATETNAVNWVVERAKVSNKKTSFDDLMGNQGKA
ncbi:MAG: trigger factor [Methylophilaceae bacterium]